MNELEISFGGPLHVVVHEGGAVAGEPSWRAAFRMETQDYTVEGENMSTTMIAGSLATVNVTWKTSSGQPAKVDGATTWASSDPTICTATVAAGNPQIANLYAPGPVGDVSIQATADADLGDGVKTITSVLALTVIPGEAVGGEIGFEQGPMGPPSPGGGK